VTRSTPPAWAEWLLYLLLSPRDRETVSGDMLELYRDAALQARGPRPADLWYVREVLRLAWLQNRGWITLLSLSMFGRTTLDWLVPTSDFGPRALWSTTFGAGIFLLAGFVAAWRSSSVVSGAFASLTTALAAGLVHSVGAVTLLAASYSPETLAAVRQSGGLSEAITLPILLCSPAVALGAAAAIDARLLSTVTSCRS